jgi:Radical SAM superfamily/Iron-sulfur cluster-binding domain
MPDSGLRLTGDEFTAHQALSSRQVTFSLTESCPLRCSHCIVDTVPASDHSRTMTLEDATSLAAKLPELVPRGVCLIGFTGGEPFLAPRQLRVLSRAAAEAGMNCTVVTACHWARSVEGARRVIAGLPGIHNWHLSTDIFHTEFVPVSWVVSAALAAATEGRTPMIRIAANLPLSGKSAKLYDEVSRAIPDSIPVFVQPITPNGRAADLNTDLMPVAAVQRDVPVFPCVPNGMVVRYDGSVAPCCAGLVQQREGHPFQFGNAVEAGLAAVHEQWCTDSLLQLIRSVGFAPLIRWVRESFPQHPLAASSPEHPCECCLKLWQEPGVGAEMRRRAESPAMRSRVAEMTQRLFQEPFMSNMLTDSAPHDFPKRRNA